MLQQTTKSSWFQKLTPGYRALGIEMTETKIKMIETAHTGNCGFSIEHFSEIGLPNGTIEDGKIVNALAITQALHTLLHRTDLRTKKVHFVLPSSLTMVRFIKLPDVRTKDLKRMIDFELKYNIPLPFDNPYYDFMKISGESASNVIPLNKKTNGTDRTIGIREVAAAAESPQQPSAACDVMIVAAPLEVIQEYAGLLANAGLKVQSIEIKPLSLFRVIERLRIVDPLSTFMMVDVNEAYTDVSIYYAGALRISRNIHVKFPAGPDAAYGTLADLELANASQELAAEMNRLINFYRYTLNHRDHEIENILVSGDTPLITEIIASLRERLNYNVSILEANDIHSQSGAFASRLATYAVPLGLSLRGGQG